MELKARHKAWMRLRAAHGERFGIVFEPPPATARMSVGTKWWAPWIDVKRLRGQVAATVTAGVVAGVILLLISQSHVLDSTATRKASTPASGRRAVVIGEGAEAGEGSVAIGREAGGGR